jgi:hypothetical protein
MMIKARRGMDSELGRSVSARFGGFSFLDVWWGFETGMEFATGNWFIISLHENSQGPTE